MRLKTIGFSLAALSLSIASPAFADNIADCEIVILQTVEDESGRGGAQVASYGPADEFLASVYDKDVEIIQEIGGLPIQAVMCKRIDIIPTKSDFKILATGIPLFLSQSFDSQDSDLISLFYKEGAFRKTYSGPGLTDETQGLLETRLDEFNGMEHGLAEKEAPAKAKIEAEAEEKKSLEKEEEAEVEQTVSLEVETERKTDVDLESLASEDLVETLDTDLETTEPVSLITDVQEETELQIEAVEEKIEDISEIAAISSTEEITTTLEQPLETE